MKGRLDGCFDGHDDAWTDGCQAPKPTLPFHLLTAPKPPLSSPTLM